MQDSFSSILDRLSTSLNDVDQRLTIWKSNFDFLVKYPFNGTGLTGATSIQETAGFSTHNSFLQIPVETGIVGTAIFSIILIRMIFGMWKMRRFNRYIFSAYITILTAIIINGMAESQILLPGTVFFYPFWLIILSLRANISNTKKPENVT